MKAYDFEYDGVTLSNFGFVICNFDYNGTETISNGSQITFNTVSMLNGAKHELTSTTFENCLETVIQICKNPCSHDSLEISVEELRRLSRWLNRKQFHKFKILNEEYLDIYFEASFNVSQIVVGGKVCGLELEMRTNKPFALQEPIKFTLEHTDVSQEIHWRDFSDVEGFIYPEMKITVNEAGNLDIYNAKEDRTTSIANCLTGETITMKYPIIETDNKDHKIQNDFNWVFFRLANNFKDSTNHVMISLPCKIEITYSPPVKVGI